MRRLRPKLGRKKPTGMTEVGTAVRGVSELLEIKFANKKL